MAEALRDLYANIITFDITQSAANVLTFDTVETNVGIDSSRRSGVAILVDEINYYIAAPAITEMTSVSDELIMGITISSGVTDLADMTDRRILDQVSLLRADFGTAAAAQIIQFPIQKQFFPPLIMAERQIHFGLASGGLASAARARCRIFYRSVQITAEQFVEIAEVFRLVS